MQPVAPAPPESIWTPTSPELPPAGRCAYEYRHPNRPRRFCGRDVDRDCQGNEERVPPGRCACFWHCSCPKGSAVTIKQNDSTLAARLKNALESDKHRYLEGASLNRANLMGAQLPDGAHLEHADLGGVRLQGASLVGAYLEHASLPRACLQRANLKSARLLGASLNEGRLEHATLTYAHLEHADLTHAYLNGAWLEEASLDHRTTCEGTCWGIPAEEDAGKWHQAASVLRMIGRHYAEKGDHERAHRFYLREMECSHCAVMEKPPEVRITLRIRTLRLWLRVWRMRRVKYLFVIRGCWWNVVGQPFYEWCRSHRRGKPLRRSSWWCQKWLWRYGVSPMRVFCWMVLVIVASALIFHFTGGVEGPCRWTCLPHWLNWLQEPLDVLTLSLITFSTLGYGNWHPGSNSGHLVAGLEGILGVLLAAAFLVSLATKYVHRD